MARHGISSAVVERYAFISGVVLVGMAAAQVASRAPASHTAAQMAFRHDRDVNTAFIWREFPEWDGSLLVGIDANHSRAPIIYTIDKDGRRDETLFTLPDSGRIDVGAIAGSLDGAFALIGGAITSDSRAATFLARISPDRKQNIVTRVWPYCPFVVTFAGDGTLWTVGHLKDNENTHEVAENVLRRFDIAGKMLSSTTLNAKGFASAGDTYLRASQDLVGWFTGEEYIEFALSGVELRRYDVPKGGNRRDFTGLAIDEQNHVIVSWFGNRNAEFLALDRDTGSWNSVQVPKEETPTWSKVLGFDGNILITTSSSGTLQRFKPAE